MIAPAPATAPVAGLRRLARLMLRRATAWDTGVHCRNAGITSVANSPADWRVSSNVMSPKANSIAT